MIYVGSNNIAREEKKAEVDDPIEHLVTIDRN
jgi:hypothetical protein